jgi:8-oxo-dGTP pyrophosphatase MutT (NUDIX family)
MMEAAGVCRCYNRAVTREAVRAAIAAHEKATLSGPRLVKSAVLIPLLSKDDELHVLLTERTQEVRSHKGQVCFPGGTVQRGDGSLLDTALREAWEETGLRPEDVDIIGEIDDNVVHSTGYVITPFVGFIPYPYPFRANALETREIFFVPLRLLMDATKFYRQTRTIGEYFYSGPVCDYEGHVIWGATGRILEHLMCLLRGADESAPHVPTGPHPGREQHDA